MGDIDLSGTVTNADVQALLNLLKAGGGLLAAVPEPESITLIACALPGLAFVVARRRGLWRYRIGKMNRSGRALRSAEGNGGARALPPMPIVRR